MSWLGILASGWAIVALAMVWAWDWQRRHRDAGIVDVCWSAAMGFLAIWCAFWAEGDVARRLLVGVLGGAWAARLAWHIATDRVLGKPEDGRYQRLRAHWGERAQPMFFLFFQAQALAAAVFALPFLAAASAANPPPGWALVTAVFVWLVAVVGETVADRQLAAFRADPANKGKTCREGLWRYSRHPNYFFEWLHWFTYPLLAWGEPWAVAVALLGPAAMLATLLKGTGIPYTEMQAAASRADYRDYQATTSMFIPWPPKEKRA